METPGAPIFLGEAEAASIAHEQWVTRVEARLGRDRWLSNNSCMAAPQRMRQCEVNTACTDHIESQVPAVWDLLNVSGSADRVGQAATRGLLYKVIAMRREIEDKEYRHGRATAASIE